MSIAYRHIALIGLGLKSISMAPAGIGPVKSMLLALDAGLLQKTLFEELERDGTGTPMREVLSAFAAEHDIPL